MMPRDLRGLAPPGPLEIILAEVDEAKPGKQLAYVLPHFPGPLASLLAEQGVRLQSQMLPDFSGVVLTLQLPG
ncbi:DUF2249 domain-containing protein [Vogesella sp. XCS3]|uniref:DUF2249 domain-containing protein n=1 Tax=Vogesella sp. XCS3 TaxID=2877939 RepID=UPI001D0A6157|nr:DUF2249 domain-containing protein [Vogesella sp. XCS3]UDM16794.1 DUF2249 domain-containing protein [Vogesella sp. XCS3]